MHLQVPSQVRVRNRVPARRGAMTQEKVAFAGAQSKNRAGRECRMERLNGRRRRVARGGRVFSYDYGYCTKALPVTCGMVTVFERSGDVMLTV